MADKNFTDGNINYENTVSRIVNEGFRFSKEISPEIYTFYKEWILSKKPDVRTEIDKKYLSLYKNLPKKKASAKAEQQCPYDEDDD